MYVFPKKVTFINKSKPPIFHYRKFQPWICQVFKRWGGWRWWSIGRTIYERTRCWRTRNGQGIALEWYWKWKKSTSGHNKYLLKYWMNSDADLNSSQTKFKRTKMLILVKLLAKYIIIIYALGSVHEKFSFWIKANPKSFHSRNSWLG